MTTGLTQSDHAALTAAIRAAETATAGEIHVVVARRSDPYFYPAAFMLAIGVLLASLLATLLLAWSWVAPRLVWFVLVQALAFGCAVGVLSVMPGLRIHLVPRALRYRRAHDNAMRQFLARNIHRTAARTGVLIFVSLDERYAEVIADAGIDEKVPADAWTEMIAGLTAAARRGALREGIEAAIAQAGRLLAAHFPPRPGDENELDDHVVEI